MKKLLIIFATVLMLSSCGGDYNFHSEDHTYDKNMPWSGVYKYTYDGHDYIEFIDGHRAGVVHNPECKKCKENGRY